MRVLLLQLDGKLPNIALMRIAAHHRALGHDFELQHGCPSEQPSLFERPWDKVYASAIFERTKPLAERVRRFWPEAIIGGTGWDPRLTLEDIGITIHEQDYSIYPDFVHSIGFTQRGCRFRCPFCVVPRKEGTIRQEQTITELWRGEPTRRELLLLDNDFFGQPAWRERITEIREGRFRVCFTQGINFRTLTDEQAAALASVDYRDDSMTARRLYTAWDNPLDGERLLSGLRRLTRYGVRPDSIMVYMLIGYWPGETHGDRERRRKALRDFGARPYPMPYRRTPELVGYQRWVVRRADLTCSWEAFQAARYRPEKVG